MILICKVLTSTSANIGFAPDNIIDETAVPKFKHGVTTSSPFLIFKTFVASVKADDPELTIKPYFLANNLEIFVSKFKTDFPI